MQLSPWRSLERNPAASLSKGLIALGRELRRRSAERRRWGTPTDRRASCGEGGRRDDDWHEPRRVGRPPAEVGCCAPLYGFAFEHDWRDRLRGQGCATMAS